MSCRPERWFALAGIAVVLAACSSGGSGSPDLAPVSPVDPIVSQPIAPLPPGPLTAGQIAKALGERSFAYAGAGRNGTIKYYSDGTFSYEEAGKGSGTGLWQSSDSKLCEARNPASFLPKGTPSTCSPFSSNGRTYTAGMMQLTPI